MTTRLSTFSAPDSSEIPVNELRLALLPLWGRQSGASSHETTHAARACLESEWPAASLSTARWESLQPRPSSSDGGAVFTSHVSVCHPDSSRISTLTFQASVCYRLSDVAVSRSISVSNSCLKCTTHTVGYLPTSEAGGVPLLPDTRKPTLQLLSSSVVVVIIFHPQNHVATNVVAILVGSLVVVQHSARASQWLARAVELYERTVGFLALVKDGSMTEGVGYVGYTVRSLSQYVVLLRRHLGVDHTSHPWLRRHLDFYYYTTLPGLQVGQVYYTTLTGLQVGQVYYTTLPGLQVGQVYYTTLTELQVGHVYYTTLPGLQVGQVYYTTLAELQVGHVYYTTLPGLQVGQVYYTTLTGLQVGQVYYTTLPGLQVDQVYYTTLPGLQVGQVYYTTLTELQVDHVYYTTLPGLQVGQVYYTTLTGLQVGQVYYTTLPGLQVGQVYYMTLPGLQVGQVYYTTLTGLQVGQVYYTTLPGLQVGQVYYTTLPGLQVGQVYYTTLTELQVGQVYYTTLPGLQVGQIYYMTLPGLQIDHVYYTTLQRLQIDHVYYTTLPGLQVGQVYYTTLQRLQVGQIYYMTLPGLQIDHVYYTTLQRLQVGQIYYMTLPGLQIDHVYYTTLQRLQLSVGLADCPPSWFYGPESQLVFLDSFVLRRGDAHWLAAEIRRRRARPDPRPLSHRYTTLHTEFLWYDPTVTPRPSPHYSEAELHYFSDWGVVTYRSGSITDSTSTFVSFKSGKLHGRAVYDSVHAAGGPDAVRAAWRHFNAGHEHPDQNSFTFSPAGRRLITDGLYGPKLTYLNNVLMLAPGDASACTRPWTGQLGDCDRWLRWTGAEDGRSHGQVVAAQTVHDVVFVAGEAVGAYHDSLLLSSVRRSLVLLKPDLLVVTDDLRLLPDSHVTHVSVFFNNHERPFRSAVHSMCRPPLSGVQMEFDDGLYGVMWTSAAGQSPIADVMLRNYSSSRGLLHTSNVNVTYAMEGRHTRLIHVIYGPQATPTSLQVVGDTVRITTAQDTYNVTVQSDDTVSSPLCSVTSLHDTVTFYPSKNPRQGHLLTPIHVPAVTTHITT
ncbi:hypothetical protein LSAT2_029079 [Lamellibrachia satsuma]|nr:hypothetical protein LSAT2_029079 [Lamellibrachia satsuma]